MEEVSQRRRDLGNCWQLGTSLKIPLNFLPNSWALQPHISDNNNNNNNFLLNHFPVSTMKLPSDAHNFSLISILNSLFKPFLHNIITFLLQQCPSVLNSFMSANLGKSYAAPFRWISAPCAVSSSESFTQLQPLFPIIMQSVNSLSTTPPFSTAVPRLPRRRPCSKSRGSPA